MVKIYCAGPLFNRKEKEEMAEIASILESHGYTVFLPQRDGLEFSGLFPEFVGLGISEDSARKILNKAIFALDVFEVLSSQGLVLNINGRVPDEGAMVEACVAWSAGKKIVIYKNDARTLMNGTDNPLLLGLADFEIVTVMDRLPSCFADPELNDTPEIIDATFLKSVYTKGEKISFLAKEPIEKSAICTKLMEVLEEANEQSRIGELLYSSSCHTE